MNISCYRALACATICTLLATSAGSLNAEHVAHPYSVFITNDTGKIVGITIGLVAVGAAIGFGVYYGVYHKASLTGCAANTPDGLQITSEKDHQTWTAIGDVAAIKPGDRVRVSGKKQKRDTIKHQFLVEKLSKDYGPCKV